LDSASTVYGNYDYTLTSHHQTSSVTKSCG